VDARLHLRLGLDLELAQMGAQADDVVGELEHSGAQGVEILFGAGAQDADLTGIVDQSVDGAGLDAQGDVGGLERFAWRRGRGRQRFGARDGG
jgi:hypothetical protein